LQIIDNLYKKYIKTRLYTEFCSIIITNNCIYFLLAPSEWEKMTSKKIPSQCVTDGFNKWWWFQKKNFFNLARKQLISQFMLSYVFKKIYMISKWCILSGKQQLVIRNFEWNQTTQARTWNWPLPNSEPYSSLICIAIIYLLCSVLTL